MPGRRRSRDVRGRLWAGDEGPDGPARLLEQDFRNNPASLPEPADTLPGPLRSKAGEDHHGAALGQGIRACRDDGGMGWAKVRPPSRNEVEWNWIGTAPARRAVRRFVAGRPTRRKVIRLQLVVADVPVGLDGQADVGPSARQPALKREGSLTLGVGLGQRAVDDQRPCRAAARTSRPTRTGQRPCGPARRGQAW